MTRGRSERDPLTRGRSDATRAAPQASAAVDPAAAGDGEIECLTCGDVATRMRVLVVKEAESLALCLDERERRLTVDTGIVGAVVPGDTLLVHAGAAIIREPA
jgi:hypothetical protein